MATDKEINTHASAKEKIRFFRDICVSDFEESING